MSEPFQFGDHVTKGSVVGRTLPHSLEAEEYLLSCCLLDGKDVVDRCIRAGISSESFYDSKHGIIFERIVDLFNRKIEIDISVVAEELKTAGLIDAIGGYGLLTQISKQIPTTAQTGYFIDKVREQAVLRALIRESTKVAEDCFSFSGDLSGFLERHSTKLGQLFSESKHSISGFASDRIFNSQRLVSKPAPIYTLAGTTISTPGNLTAVYAHVKAGKSSAIAAMMSAAMTNPASGHDCLGFVGPNYAKHALLHFDTEQSEYDWQQVVHSSLRRIGEKVQPDWLLSHFLTGIPAPDCRLLIKDSIRAAYKKFGGVHSVIIDGIADLVIDPNSAEECFPLLTELHEIAIECKTAIVAILHLNPGQEAKGRGHLGSQLERKAETNLMLEKDEKEVTRMWAPKQRGKAITKEKAIAFKWDETTQMHRSLKQSDQGSETRISGSPKTTFAQYASVFPTEKNSAQGLAQLYRTARMKRPITAAKFQAAIDVWIQEGVLLVDETNPNLPRYYRKM